TGVREMRTRVPPRSISRWSSPLSSRARISFSRKSRSIMDSGPLQVLVLATIHLHDVPLLDEERDLNDGPRLQGGRLRSALGRVAPDARIRLGDGKGHEIRKLDSDDPVVVDESLALHVLLEVPELVL